MNQKETRNIVYGSDKMVKIGMNAAQRPIPPIMPLIWSRKNTQKQKLLDRVILIANAIEINHSELI